MFPAVEVRHLHAVIVLAEELNFTRAAHRLFMSQPGLSKHITDFEEQHGLHLFVSEKGRTVELTAAGRAFVEEARTALFHTERAIHLARAAQEGRGGVLTMGHSPNANQAWVSAILAIRRSLYPMLKVRLTTRFAMELVRSVLSGELNLALVTAPLEDARITAIPFARAPLYAALPGNHAAAHKECLTLRDLAHDDWILFAKQAHPIVYDMILETARREAIVPKYAHDIFTAQQAFHLVSEHVGVAILTHPTAFGLHEDAVVLKPLSDKSLYFETCLIMRADDESRTVNEFARSFLRKHAPGRLSASQMELPLLA